MKNKKLHLINELLNEFDMARSRFNSQDALTMLDGLQERLGTIQSSHTKEDVFYKILDFISLEVNYAIELECEKLNADDNQASSEVVQNG